MHLLDKFRVVSQRYEDHAGNDKWEFPEEAHASRRREILEKHPEIMKFPRYDTTCAVLVTGYVLLQLVMLTYVSKLSWPMVIMASYFVSGTVNHILGIGMHEIGHNLAFGNHRPFLNRLLGYWCNLPLFVPMSVSYKRYHHEHHKYMGDEHRDVDVPLATEIKYVRSSLAKLVWLFFHPVIHATRPFIKRPKVFSPLELLNIIIQVVFDLVVLKMFGAKGCMYLLLGTFFGFGLHPFAAHFFSEHYMYAKNIGTMSHYGPMNTFLFNVGYHNEHHDFPFVPFSCLPVIRNIASEFYDDLPFNVSWLRVLFDFVMDPKIGPHAHSVGYLKEDLKEERSNMKNKLVDSDNVSADSEHSLAYKQD